MATNIALSTTLFEPLTTTGFGPKSEATMSDIELAFSVASLAANSKSAAETPSFGQILSMLNTGPGDVVDPSQQLNLISNNTPSADLAAALTGPAQNVASASGESSSLANRSVDKSQTGDASSRTGLFGIPLSLSDSQHFVAHDSPPRATDPAPIHLPHSLIANASGRFASAASLTPGAENSLHSNDSRGTHEDGSATVLNWMVATISTPPHSGLAAVPIAGHPNSSPQQQSGVVNLSTKPNSQYVAPDTQAAAISARGVAHEFSPVLTASDATATPTPSGSQPATPSSLTVPQQSAASLAEATNEGAATSTDANGDGAHDAVVALAFDTGTTSPVTDETNSVSTAAVLDQAAADQPLLDSSFVTRISSPRRHSDLSREMKHENDKFATELERLEQQEQSDTAKSASFDQSTAFDTPDQSQSGDGRNHSNSSIRSHNGETLLSSLQSDHLAKQLAAEVDEARHTHRDRFEIELDPPELGKIRVQIREGAAGVDIQLVVADERAHNAAVADMSRLRAALQQAGVTIDQLNVAMDFSAQRDQHHNASSNPAQAATVNNGMSSQRTSYPVSHTNNYPSGGPSRDGTVNLIC